MTTKLTEAQRRALDDVRAAGRPVYAQNGTLAYVNGRHIPNKTLFALVHAGYLRVVDERLFPYEHHRRRWTETRRVRCYTLAIVPEVTP